MNDRYKVLKALFEFDEPLPVISSQLKSLDWDFEGEPLVLKRHHLIRVLDAYIADKKDKKDIEYWANLM